MGTHVVRSTTRSTSRKNSGQRSWGSGEFMGTCLNECFGDVNPQKTLVVVTMGGNDAAAIAKDGIEGKPLDELWLDIEGGFLRLHLRLAAIFALAALVPTVIVALFAAFTLDVWLENLFSDRIGSVLRNSLTTAQAYEREHRSKLRLLSNACDRDLPQVGDGAVRSNTSSTAYSMTTVSVGPSTWMASGNLSSRA